MEEENIQKIATFIKDTIEKNSAYFNTKLNIEQFKTCDLNYFKNSIKKILENEPNFNLLDYISKIEQFKIVNYPKTNEDLLKNFRNKHEKIKICQEILLQIIKSEICLDTEKKKKISYPLWDPEYKRGAIKRLKKL